MRNAGGALILILIGITIFVVSSRNNAVTVSHAKLTNDVQIQETELQNTSAVPEPPAQIYIPDSIVAVNEVAIESPPDSAKISQTEKETGTRPIKVEKVADESQGDNIYERLLIPSLKVNGKLHSIPYSELTWDLTTLGQDLALLEDIPGRANENNIVIAGHITVRNGSNGPFRYLWKLNPGEKVILQDDRFVYTYVVREQILVYPEQSSVIADSENPQLTLITCHTWNEETLSYLRRLVIFADLETVEAKQVYVD